MAARRTGKLLLSILLCSAAFTIPVGCRGGTGQGNTAMMITAAEAKTIMDTQTGYVILDVRSQSEYDEGHIPNAMLIPLPEIADRAEDELLDYDQLILVYCRSGARSTSAAAQLEAMGYTNVKNFGGIQSWPYEVVTE